jgi:hypothetical protein
MFLHNVLSRKIYPTLLRPRTFVHYSFSMISFRPEGLPPPRPRLFKPEWASDIRRQFFVLEKKHFYTWCAGLIVHALLTVYTPTQNPPFAHSLVPSSNRKHPSFPCSIHTHAYSNFTPILPTLKSTAVIILMLHPYTLWSHSSHPLSHTHPRFNLQNSHPFYVPMLRPPAPSISHK